MHFGSVVALGKVESNLQQNRPLVVGVRLVQGTKSKSDLDSDEISIPISNPGLVQLDITGIQNLAKELGKVEHDGVTQGRKVLGRRRVRRRTHVHCVGAAGEQLDIFDRLAQFQGVLFVLSQCAE